MFDPETPATETITWEQLLMRSNIIGGEAELTLLRCRYRGLITGVARDGDSIAISVAQVEESCDSVNWYPSKHLGFFFAQSQFLPRLHRTGMLRMIERSRFGIITIRPRSDQN
ncbi:MAG: hypothetical protein ABH846_02335 [Patescibacteria group bacterium]